MRCQIAGQIWEQELNKELYVSMTFQQMQIWNTMLLADSSIAASHEHPWGGYDW